MGTLVDLKIFLSDRPEVAFLAISLLVNVTLFSFYVRARDAHVKTLETLIPLATRLTDLLNTAVNRAKAKSPARLLERDSGPPAGE